MLSPTVSSLPSEGPSVPEPTTRRRGLSYLRGLSSHSSSATNSDQSRPSPRSFFQRSSSYNNESKSKPATGRRRSTSRPNEPTFLSSDRPVLNRVLSAGNSPAPGSPIPPAEDTSSSEENTRARTVQTTQNSLQTASIGSETMARTVRPSTPRRVTDTSVPTAADAQQSQASTNARPVSMAVPSTNSTANDATSPTNPSAKVGNDEEKPKAPMLRLFPHQDLRNNGRQSLNFSPISRTLPSESSIIRVGRYSEREGLPVANPATPSDAPVGFKSKVVSRKHCEFSFNDGQWHIRDVASSSGTFLNHIRLSQPNQESRLFPVKDGDIVQLGIDFRGGEEMIFRCVKIRIECNRSWQKKPNTFNKTRQAQLLGLTKDQPTGGQNNGECAICLGSVLPCQALFVAPCAHVWHYKCIRPMIEGRASQYPSFQCPNCRAWTDLEADVDVAEEDMDAWMENGGDTDDHLDVDQTDRPQANEGGADLEQTVTNSEDVARSSEQQSAAAEAHGSPTASASKSSLLSRRTIAFSEPGVENMPMPDRPTSEQIGNPLMQHPTHVEPNNSDHIIAGEGPLTPRNNAGPFVFDGSGGSGDHHRRTLFVPGLFEVAENAPA